MLQEEVGTDKPASITYENVSSERLSEYAPYRGLAAQKEIRSNLCLGSVRNRTDGAPLRSAPGLACAPHGSL